MSPDADDDALSWGGGGDPSHLESPVVEEPVDESPEPQGEQPGTSSPLLVTFSVFGGAFLLYIVGWIIAVERMTGSTGNPFFDFMSTLGRIFAIAVPAVWFFGVLFIARDRSPFIRILWLLLGIVIVAPWPFILAVGAK
jgi:hypothetical protein